LRRAVLRSEKLINATEASSECRIEMVFDRIVCSTYLCDLPALKTSGDFFPFVPVSPMCLKDDAFLLICPLSFVDVRIKVVMPSTYHTCVPLTTLLTGARL
jgi:hypothetical protein